MAHAQFVSEVWSPDNGDGTYTNPVIYADYSDPDVCVGASGEDYYLTASSFQCVPGLPILHSKDLVNWEIINYALGNLYEGDEELLRHFSKPQHGAGVWAPSIRYHDGWYYIYWGDPDFGVYMVKTKDPAGKWEKPVCVIKGQGYISERDIDHLEEYTTNPAHAAYARRTRKRVEDIHDLLDQDIDKAHALFKSFEDREDAMRRIRQIADLELCDAFPINLEVSAPGINKGEGLKILGEKLGIGTKDMMAFGDSNNDAAMLQTAGVAVVMDNAYESVKEMADVIAPSNEEDGVAAVIEQMLE